MDNRWIVDVLADLYRFTEANDLVETQKGLRAVLSIAEAEIARPALIDDASLSAYMATANNQAH